MKRKPRLEYYKDEAGEWRWRAIGGNGQILSGPEEGFTRRSAAVRNAKLTAEAILQMPAIAGSDAIN